MRKNKMLHTLMKLQLNMVEVDIFLAILMLLHANSCCKAVANCTPLWNFTITNSPRKTMHANLLYHLHNEGSIVFLII